MYAQAPTAHLALSTHFTTPVSLRR